MQCLPPIGTTLARPRVSNDRTFRALAAERVWTRNGDSLECELAIHEAVLPLAMEHAIHRLRSVRARPLGFLHPLDVSVTERRICLRFAPGTLDQSAHSQHDSTDWVRDSLVPLLEAVVLCHEANAFGFGSSGVTAGRCVPSVTWFLPLTPETADDDARTRDLQVVSAWLRTELRLVALGEDDRRHGRNAQLVIDRDGVEGIRDWLKEMQIEDRLGTRGVPKAGLIRCLTEFELFVRMTEVYRYRVLEEPLAKQFGIRPSDGLVLRVDKNWIDPHFGALKRPTAQELWDQLTEESRTTPLVIVSADAPNPLQRAPFDATPVRWIGVHTDQPFLFLDGLPGRLPSDGYVRTMSVGDDTLMERKRKFANFADRHPTLGSLLTAPVRPRPFVANTFSRDSLEDSILSTRGVFAVQGPPGTGKTYLASQVVRRFLEQTPGGRVLVCSKEHFALDHIVKKISSTLEKASVPFRAWRSVPQGRRRAEIAANRWAAAQVERDLAGRAWSENAVEWTQWQTATNDIHDLRVATLARNCANVMFTTTCDMTMTDFLDRESFDLVIVEEAGKCYPSELLHALCLGRTTLMIGDQFQLPPYQEDRTREGAHAWIETIRRAGSDAGRRQILIDRFGDIVRRLGPALTNDGFNTDDSLLWLRPFEYLFERLSSRFRLNEQFRLESPLSRVVGSVFYGEPFVHKKYDLPESSRPTLRPLGDSMPKDLDVPLLWLNTPHMAEHADATEDRAKQGLRDNHYEHDLLIAYLKRLRAPSTLDVVILTPYKAQKRLLVQSDELRSICAGLSDQPLENLVRTTDEYQGREAELTILSLVRNNSLGARAWGFMTSPERLNVMFSRARFRQVVIGCGAHIERHSSECQYLHAVWKAYQAEAADEGNARIIPAAEVLSG